MKNLLLLSLFAVSSLTWGQVPPAKKLSDQVFLDNTKLAIPSLKFFKDYFSKPRALTMKEVERALLEHDSEPKDAVQMTKYQNGVLPLLNRAAGKNFEDADAWKKGNPKIAKGISLYVESPDIEGLPMWQVINNKLRSGAPMTATESKAMKEILFSLDHLPSVAGIMFRGAGMKPEYFGMYKKGKVAVEPTFISTSLSLNVARGYADMSGTQDYNQRPTAGKISTIFIVKVKRGAPVSAVVMDYLLEFEALLRPRTSFRVHDVLIGKKQAYVFLEEI